MEIKNFEDIDKVAIEMYSNGCSLTKISNKLKIDRGSLSVRLKKKNIKIINNNHRLYYIHNEDFFEKIDTEEKAYWLGFLLADGYLSKPNNNRYIIELGLASIDKHHIEKFLKDIDSNYLITDRVANDKKSKTSRVMIYSKKMYYDLTRNNCSNNKSFNVSFPENIDNNMYRHIIRGIFDGDGCIKTHNNLINYAGICSANKEFLIQLKNILEENDIYFVIKKDHTCFSLKSGKVSEFTKFLDYIYKDSHVYLDRKFNKYLINNDCRLSRKLGMLSARKIGGELEKEDTEVITISDIRRA